MESSSFYGSSRNKMIIDAANRVITTPIESAIAIPDTLNSDDDEIDRFQLPSKYYIVHIYQVDKVYYQ